MLNYNKIITNRPTSLNVKVKRIDWAQSEQMLLDVMSEFSVYDGDLREALTRSGGPPLLFEPATINLHSLPPMGDSVQLRFTNCLDCPIGFAFSPPSIPSWLQLDCIEGTVAPGAIAEVRASCHHIRASEAYGDEMGSFDAACGAGARALLEVACRPEVTGLLLMQLRALGGGSEQATLAGVSVPVVVYLGVHPSALN